MPAANCHPIQGVVLVQRPVEGERGRRAYFICELYTPEGDVLVGGTGDEAQDAGGGVCAVGVPLHAVRGCGTAVCGTRCMFDSTCVGCFVMQLALSELSGSFSTRYVGPVWRSVCITHFCSTNKGMHAKLTALSGLQIHNVRCHAAVHRSEACGLQDCGDVCCSDVWRAAQY